MPDPFLCSLTFEGVRRLLEKDLVLDTYALDVHKRYVKQLLEKYLSEAEAAENVSKGSEEIKLAPAKEEDEKLKEQKVTDIRPEDEGKIEDSPVMGLLSGNESAKSGVSETQANAQDKIPTVDMIKDALWKRATYFKSKSEYVLNSQNDTEDKTGSVSDADSSHSEGVDVEVEVKPKKKSALKGKVQVSEKPKKRKRPAKEPDEKKRKRPAKEPDEKKRKRPAKEPERPRKKQTKHAEETSDEKNNEDVDDDSSAEKSVKKDVVAPVYGKKVERLKSIIKSCGMSVAPTVYKKVKQVPEDKREAFLIKELQEILSKEGLSTNPTEKGLLSSCVKMKLNEHFLSLEIKEVKRKKERAKELEGIDTSNIVLGSRRRSTFNFLPPPKPKEPVEPDADDSEDDDNDDGDDDSEDSDKDDGDDSEDVGKDDGDDSEDVGKDDGDDSEDVGKDDGDASEDVGKDNGDDKDEDDNVHASASEPKETGDSD
ncbi:hypothetical protein OSB04_005498 [Centaurea solstitialis]|uniref:Histone chaperone domain-containing protein n=1 Tax=Centaurea solstitialis TaxID=347529 RepID=A0AA38TG48_9ASTR|nr:hypothetical protein OSB04_005498 [Centaurea solstitialis]